MRLTALKTASSSDFKHQIAFLATTSSSWNRNRAGKTFHPVLKTRTNFSRAGCGAGSHPCQTSNTAPGNCVTCTSSAVPES